MSRGTSIAISQQGAAIINSASVEREGDGIVAIHVDLRSKRATVDGIMSDSSGEYLCIGVDENTFYIDESKGRHIETVISFPEYDGWNFFAYRISKYLLFVCLLKDWP